MELKFYTKLKTDRVRMASAIGVNEKYLIMIVNGYKKPSGKLAQAIEAYTNGKVKKSTLRPDLWN